MKTFHETLRHDHPIAADDYILEIGGHCGQDSHVLNEKYGCRVIAYEPVQQFFHQFVVRFLDRPRVIGINAGVCGGTVDQVKAIAIHGEKSGVYAAGEHVERCVFRPIAEILSTWHSSFERWPALVSINCEGGEYPILESLLDTGLVANLPRIQVQMHSVIPDCRVRRAQILERMAKTHAMLWAPSDEFDTTWIGWVRL